MCHGINRAEALLEMRAGDARLLEAERAQLVVVGLTEAGLAVADKNDGAHGYLL